MRRRSVRPFHRDRTRSSAPHLFSSLSGRRNRVPRTNGKGIRLKVKDVRVVGRITQGVKLINMSDKDTIASIARLVDAPEEDEEGSEEAVDLFNPT